jgi:outer membrane protein assembly factor BamB
VVRIRILASNNVDLVLDPFSAPVEVLNRCQRRIRFNYLRLTPEHLSDNVLAVTKSNGIRPDTLNPSTEPDFCIEMETGRPLWTERMPPGLIWASPVRAGDRLYVTNQRGTTVVFRANPEKFELLAENDLGESSNSTLAVADRQVFLRTFENLYCIEEPQGR